MKKEIGSKPCALCAYLGQEILCHDQLDDILQGLVAGKVDAIQLPDGAQDLLAKRKDRYKDYEELKAFCWRAHVLLMEKHEGAPTVEDAEEAKRLVEDGAIAVKVKTHPDLLLAGDQAELDRIRDVCEAVGVPVFASGDLDQQNAILLRGCGLAGIKVGKGLMRDFSQETPKGDHALAIQVQEATRKLKMIAKSVGEKWHAGIETGFIFDMDGTLLDSLPYWDQLGARYLADYGIEAEPDLGQKLFEMTIEESAQYFKERYGLDKTPEELSIGLDEKMREFYCSEIPLKPGVRDFLDQAHRRGIPMVVATTTTRRIAVDALEYNDMLKYFKDVVTPRESMKSKHFDKIYLMAAAACGTLPEKSWVFEDAFYGANTAYKAGFKVAGILDEESLSWEEEMKKVSSIFFESFEEVDLDDFLK